MINAQYSTGVGADDGPGWDSDGRDFAVTSRGRSSEGGLVLGHGRKRNCSRCPDSRGNGGGISGGGMQCSTGGSTPISRHNQSQPASHCEDSFWNHCGSGSFKRDSGDSHPSIGDGSTSSILGAGGCESLPVRNARLHGGGHGERVLGADGDRRQVSREVSKSQPHVCPNG